ncbi:beta family protein [Plantibacter sp. YIM 135347]|uniref:beta family protein n=1 Tax=Plantibacter sp. YIM 135347 TaxID=3423919 RepID=UPI003D357D5D
MYQPILKGKKGEFDAWSAVSSNRRSGATPLFEVITSQGFTADLQKFVAGLDQATQADDVVAVDAHALADAVEPSTGILPYSWVAQNRAVNSPRIRPVFRLDDTMQFALDAIGIAAEYEEFPILRIGGNEAEPAPDPSDRSLQDLAARLGTQCSALHVLIDLASIHGSGASAQQHTAEAYLRWAAGNGPWASVTLAAGAFPSQITTLPKGVGNEIPRTDAELYNTVAALGIVSGLRFGDYAVRHPDLVDGPVYNGPLPNLRYTGDDVWIVWRESKDKKNPHNTFYDVCAGIVSLPAFRGAAFSPSDGIIESKSRRVPGPGAGTEWIAYGVGQHIEQVLDRLTNLGVA